MAMSRSPVERPGPPDLQGEARRSPGMCFRMGEGKEGQNGQGEVEPQDG